MPKFSTLLKLGRWVRSRFVSDGLILLYHRVSDPKSDNDPDPFALCVTPQHFTDHMKWLRDFTNPISLQSMVQGLQEKKLPPRAVSVTFDDGYADNLYQANPILEKYSIPATVFVIAGCIGGVYWWDQIARIILKTNQIPNHLSLHIGNRLFSTKIDSNSTQGRKRLLRKLHGILRNLPTDERYSTIAKLSIWAGVNTSTNEWSRPMTDSEIRKLAENGLIEVGSHTLNHNPLSILDTFQQEEEIKYSKKVLEEILNDKVFGFSYPYGLQADFSSVTIKIIQEADYKYACTNHTDVVRFRSDPFQLPRYWINDLTVNEFAYHINNWLSK
jgi:peptidoglycan/xylan/chitin deacetylase (PgdA/CDA1 family)